MTKEIERFIRIQSPSKGKSDADTEWRILPNGNRVRVWELGNVDALPEETDAGGARRYIFHIGFLDGISKGCRVNYMGSSFAVLSVSDSTRLRGLELRCVPVAS